MIAKADCFGQLRRACSAISAVAQWFLQDPKCATGVAEWLEVGCLTHMQLFRVSLEGSLLAMCSPSFGLNPVPYVALPIASRVLVCWSCRRLGCTDMVNLPDVLVGDDCSCLYMSQVGSFSGRNCLKSQLI